MSTDYIELIDDFTKLSRTLYLYSQTEINRELIILLPFTHIKKILVPN